MGDRTTVTLTVLTAHAEATKLLFDYEFDEYASSGILKSFGFEGINYGELLFLDELKNAGIAYDSYWGNGDEYVAGTKSLRFTPVGAIENKIICDDESDAPLSSLLALIEQPDKLRQYILDRQKNYSVLPWDNQLEYGKLYLATQLINPG